MDNTEIARALMVQVEMLQKEIKQLKIQEFILTVALEAIRTVSVYRADDTITEFIEQILALGPDHEKD